MSLQFTERAVLHDLAIFLERAERLGATAARFVVGGGVLSCTIPVLTPKHMLDTSPLMLGMRVSAADAAVAEADRTVAIRAILERIAFLPVDATGPLPWPPVELTQPWAGTSAPRTGWRQTHEIALPVVQARAEATLAPLADVTTTQPEDVMARVLGDTDSVLSEATGLPIPAGLAAAAQSLGFLVGEHAATLAVNGRWIRLSTGHGHVLARLITDLG